MKGRLMVESEEGDGNILRGLAPPGEALGQSAPTGGLCEGQRATRRLHVLVADDKLRASRISSRRIRISEADLQAYLDGQANMSALLRPSAKITGAHDDQ